MPRKQLGRPAEPSPASLSVEQMQAAFGKLDRRIAEIDATQISSVSGLSDPGINALGKRLEHTLAEIYGVESLEYDRYRHSLTSLFRGPVRSGMAPRDVQQGYADGLAAAKMILKSLKQLLAEGLEDARKGTAGKVLQAFNGLELHPVIASASNSLFRDGYYSKAVLDAMLALNDLVQRKSGRTDLHGTALMEQVFSPRNPILKFNALQDQSDLDEQKGYMQMMSGAMSGLRNPRAHRLVEDDPERALEFIAFVSLLAKLVDSATL